MFLLTCVTPPTMPRSLTALVKSLKSSAMERSSCFARAKKEAPPPEEEADWRGGSVRGGSAKPVPKPRMEDVGEDGKEALALGERSSRAAGGLDAGDSMIWDRGASKETLLSSPSMRCVDTGGGGGVGNMSVMSRANVGASARSGDVGGDTRGSPSAGVDPIGTSASASVNSVTLSKGRSSFHGSATQFGKSN